MHTKCNSIGGHGQLAYSIRSSASGTATGGGVGAMYARACVCAVDGGERVRWRWGGSGVHVDQPPVLPELIVLHANTHTHTHAFIAENKCLPAAQPQHSHTHTLAHDRGTCMPCDFVSSRVCVGTCYITEAPATEVWVL